VVRYLQELRQNSERYLIKLNSNLVLPMEVLMRHLRKTVRVGLLCCIFACSILVTIPQPIAAQATGKAMIAFVTADYSIREMTLSLIEPVSGKITPLLKDGYFFYPMLSPDGRHIAFLGEHPREGIQNVYVMNTDGSELRLLFEAKPKAGGPRYKPLGQVAWSPDSNEIFYGAVDGTRRPAGFFRLKLDSDEPEQILFEDFKFFYGTWITASPDGSRVAINVAIDDKPGRQIYIANADGSNAQPITATMPNGQPIDELVWSPDGQKTLLNVSMLNAIEPQPLMLGDADGGNPQPLVKAPPNYINSLSWSPDGSQIAFLATESQESKPDGEVWIANADGSGLRSLNIPINVAYVGTSWSVIPDDVTLPSEPISFVEAISKK
jgi:Tol biopolymer transport system component